MILAAHYDSNCFCPEYHAFLEESQKQPCPSCADDPQTGSTRPLRSSHAGHPGAAVLARTLALADRVAKLAAERD
jgi:hypothetical protein